MRTCLVLPLLLVAATAVAAEPPRTAEDDAARIAGQLLVGGQAFSLLAELGDRFGARLTATPSYSKAAEWAADKFKSYGLTAKLEPFTIARTWVRGPARARVVKPFEAPLHVESMGWSPPTRGRVSGELVVLKDYSPEALAKVSLKGKIVMPMRGGRAPGAPPNPKAYLAVIKGREAMAAAGVAALLMPSTEDLINNVVATGGAGKEGSLLQIPAAAIGYEDAKMLARRAESAPITVELELANRTGPAGQPPNVIAELKGERADEYIIVGAHLDSWDFATGSQDNGAGVVQVLDAARVLARMGRPPKRTIKFALWGGEEQGLLGSKGWVKAHEGELAGCVAVLNTDNGAGHPEGWKVQGRSDLETGLTPISKSLLAGLGAGKIEKTTTFDTDHAGFYLAGVPAMDLLVDDGNYRQVHHKISDTFDKVEEHNLAAGAAVLAVTAWAIAESPERLAPRLDHATVEKALEEGGYLEVMRAFGAWK